MRIIEEIDVELLDLKIDIVFQELFGKQKNAKITAEFLSLILGREIKDIDLDVNKRMLGNRKESKTGRLDVRAKFNDGEDCDIELQVEPYEHMDKRMLEYWASMYTLKINSGKKYSVLKPSISILIANYEIPNLKDILKYHTKWMLREEEHQNIILTDEIEFHIIELPKLRNANIDKDKLALWLKFIQDSSNKEVNKKMEEEENEILKQAKEELAYLSGEPEFKELVESRASFMRLQQSKEEIAREEGERRGKKEGIKENSIKTAKKLLKIKMPIKQISEITELTEEEIERIIIKNGR